MEVLFSLSITIIIIFNAFTLIKNTYTVQLTYNEDLSLGAKQLSDYLLVSSVISCHKELTCQTHDNLKYTIKIDNHRLVKQPGYEIIIDNIDDVQFINRDNYLIMKIKRNSQEISYLIGDMYKAK
ncbi:MAG: competence type IV pilus minor pilin ComGF [Eggerthia catenaformis]|uniref:competence type IV pilus minor pilin ComGF n=1 Tax=Eggerthia catenaformis TaxID=31973 RepID=UPI003CC57BC8